MKLDYRDRRFVSKNKPRRQPVGMYAAGIVAVILFVFASGFAGGWFACWYKIKKAAPSQQSAAMTQATPPVTGQQATLPVPVKGQQTPLTFYETLPKGGKGVIGSGLNANLKEHQPAPAAMPALPPQPAPAPAKPPTAVQPAAKATATVQPATKTPAPVQPAVKTPAPAAPVKPVSPQTDGERRFTVQVASVRDKAEAESLRNKIAAKGMNPVIIEVKIPEKGVVFRVRAGRHLLQREAQELAAKLGSGAIVTTE